MKRQKKNRIQNWRKLGLFKNEIKNDYKILLNSIVSQVTTLNVWSILSVHRLLQPFQHLFTSALHKVVHG